MVNVPVIIFGYEKSIDMGYKQDKRVSAQTHGDAISMRFKFTYFKTYFDK